MKKKQAKKLFDKYVRNECSVEEKALLDDYLSSFQNKTKLWSELKFDEEIKEELLMKIKSELHIDKKIISFSFKRYYKYAAIFIGLVSGIVWFQLATNQKENNIELVSDDAIIIKSSDNKLTMINENGSQVVVDENGNPIAEQNGSQIRYDNNEQIKELVFNEITIPNGRKFKLILSDGTLVHLNSGSNLKYPVNFIPGQEREVFLTGEAYFEVTNNSKTSFLVTTEKIGVQVLGTHFNVSSYKDSQTYAVLAEGSVSVFNQKSNHGKQTIIKPGEMASLTTTDIEVKDVDLNDYLSWRDDILSFNNELFIDIVKKIERQYGVQIVNNYNVLNTVRFRGSFNEETIEDLLDTFKESAEFEYEIENNRITINSKK
ncbi:MAG: FecR domain-containing protein [Maribacter stanieri]